MISLFEQAGSRSMPELPVDLVLKGARGVSLLEFSAIEPPPPESVTEGVSSLLAEHEAADRSMQMRIMIDTARADSAAETTRELEQRFSTELAEQRSAIGRLYTSFAEAREQYFAQAEEQVIRLAMAIAARVLCHEVQADVLHLQATVRAALSRVTDGSAAVLRVQPDDVPAWERLFAAGGERGVEVQADRTLVGQECVLETTIGRVELGVAVQLEEIGRGFCELLARSDGERASLDPQLSLL